MSRDNVNQIPIKSRVEELNRVASIFIKIISLMFSPEKLQGIEFLTKFDGVVENYIKQVDVLLNENTSEMQKENARNEIRIIFTKLIEEKLSEREATGMLERTFGPKLINFIVKILMEKMDSVYSNSLGVEENARCVLESVIASIVNTLMIRHQAELEAIVANNIRLGISTVVSGAATDQSVVDAKSIKNITSTLVRMTISSLVTVKGESPSLISGLLNFDFTHISRSIISTCQDSITEGVSVAVAKATIPVRRDDMEAQEHSVQQKINMLYRNILFIKNSDATESEKKSTIKLIKLQLQEFIEPKFKKIFPEKRTRDFVLGNVIELIIKKILSDSGFRELDAHTLELVILGIVSKLIHDNLFLLGQLMPAIASQAVINEVFECEAKPLRKTLTQEQKTQVLTIVNNIVDTAFSLSPESTDKKINPFRALQSIRELVVKKMTDELLEEKIVSPKKRTSPVVDTTLPSSAFTRLSGPLLSEIALLSDPSSSLILKKAAAEKIKEILFQELEPQLIYSSAGMVKTKMVKVLIGEAVDNLIALHDKEKLTDTLENIFIKIKASLETSDQFTVSDVEKIMAIMVASKLSPEQRQLHELADDEKSRAIFDVITRTILSELLKIGMENSMLLKVVSGDNFLSFLSAKILDGVVFKDPVLDLKERCGSDLSGKSKEQEAALVKLKKAEIAAFDYYDNTRSPTDHLKFLLAKLKYKAMLFSVESENATGFFSSFQQPDIAHNLLCANRMILFIDNELKGAAQAAGLPSLDALRSDDLKSICVSIGKALKNRAALTAAHRSSHLLCR